MGVIYQASLVPVRKLHRNLVFSIAVYGCGIALFACSKNILFSCAALTLLGFGMSTGSVCFNTLVQSIIDGQSFGRVMSLYTVGNIGVGPMGSLTAGIIADAMGETSPVCYLPAALFCSPMFLTNACMTWNRNC